MIAPMCGRYTLHATPERISATLEIRGPRFLEEPRYNIAPGQWVLIVRSEQGRGRVPLAARWGLVPSWTKDPEAGPKPINARAEGIASKPTFRGPLRHGRVLIPASGFYEWKQVGKAKVPHYIRPKGGGIFIFAGLMDTWLSPDGSPLPTCTIITTTPNELMAELHNRMPVILDREGAAAWLEPQAKPEQLMTPCPADWMEAWPVGPAVGNPRNDGPELVEPCPM